MNRIFKHIILFVLLISALSPVWAQDEIYIQVTIIDAETKDPLQGVTLVHGGLERAYSDDDGKIAVIVPRNIEVAFHLTGYVSDTIKNVNKQTYNLKMSNVIEVEEVVIRGDASKVKKVLVEETDIEIKGNQFHVKTSFTMPWQIFGKDKRFIFQPVLYNVTREKNNYFRPVIVDGANASINYLRLNEFNLENDELTRYVVDKAISAEDNIYSYADSLYIHKTELEDDYKVDCYMVITELLNTKKDYRDTLVIAKGTRNPLRFLDYKFAPMPLVDEKLIPTPELKNVSEVGTSNIGFVVGRAEIDAKNKNNKLEFEQIEEKLQAILKNPYATMKGISVTGYSSPEGNYATNQSLAKKRTDLILKILSGSLSSEQRKTVKLTSNSKVEPWSRVAELALKIKPELGEKVKAIVTKHKDKFPESQYEISRLKEYRKEITTNYLPLLRRVEYNLDYTIFRNLTDEEIKQKFDQNDPHISRYEYWRLVESDYKNQMVKFQDSALVKYPNFDLVANRVAIRLLEQDSLNLDILAPCIDKNVSDPIVHNQAIMALGLKEFKLADSLIRLLPDTKEFEYTKAISNALTGNFDEAYPSFQAMGGLNEVLILLCLNRDQEALDKMTALINEDPMNQANGSMWYVLAICDNRITGTMAVSYLTNAIMMDPKLEEIARIDSDVQDIIEVVAPKN